jgi:hypothetical protein
MAIHQRPAREVFDLHPTRGDAHQRVPRRDTLACNGPHIGGLLRPQSELGFPGLQGAQDSAGSVQGERPVMHGHITCPNAQDEQGHCTGPSNEDWRMVHFDIRADLSMFEPWQVLLSSAHGFPPTA